MMKNALLALALTGLVSSFGTAADNAAAFIEQGIGARAAGMGMAYVSMVGDSQAVYWNPANLSGVKNIDVNGMLTTAFETNYANLQLAYPMTDFVLGVGIYSAAISGIDRTALDTNSDSGRYVLTGESFDYSGKALFVSAGKQFTPQLSLGASVKVVNETLSTASATGFGADLGATYIVTDQLTVAATLQNALQPQLIWNTPSGNVDVVARNLKVGGNYAIFPNWFAAVDVDIRPARPFKYHLGTEYWINPSLPIRIGLDNINAQDKTFDITLGTGLYLERLRLDVSWTKPENVNVADIWRLSLGYLFNL